MASIRELTPQIVEVPAYFQADGETLFGVLTRRADDRSTTAALIVPGGWYGTSSARNRLLVRMSRALAASALPSFRFDFHGIGESTGYLERFQLTKPLTQDVRGALDWLRDNGIEHIVLIGICVGARTALAAAQDVPGLEALALVSVPVVEAGRLAGGKTTQRATQMPMHRLVRSVFRTEVVKGLFDYNLRRTYRRMTAAKLKSLGRRAAPRRRTPSDPQAEASELFLEPFRNVVSRDVPILMIYGSADHYYEEFRRASVGELGDLLARAGDRIEMEIPAAEVASFSELSVQDQVIDLIVRWTERHHDRIVATTQGTPNRPALA